MDICIFLYRISKTLWECCSYWSGLSVTNEPSGTGTGIPAKDVISVWVAHAWPQVAHTDLCVCVSESSILCGQWGCGSCKPAIALASVVLQLIYWTARHGREVVGGSRRGLVLSGSSAQQSEADSLALCTPSPFPRLMWNKRQVIWSWKPALLCFTLPVCHLR